MLAYDPMTHQYVYPQSQIADDEEQTGQPFVKTSAPPVACEFTPPPSRHPELAEANGSEAGQAKITIPWITPDVIPSERPRIPQELSV